MAVQARLMSMSQSNQPEYGNAKSRRPNIFSSAFLSVLLLVFLAAFGYASYLFFQTTRTIVLNAPQMSANPLIAADAPAGSSSIDNEDYAAQEQVDTGNSGSPLAALFAPIWNEQEPINILLLGIDQRPGEKGSYRTDTMILVNIDPRTGNIGMISMPRDLWVTIPTAYSPRNAYQ